MFKIENENDLHYKVVEYIKRFYQKALLVPAGLGENQRRPEIEWITGHIYLLRSG